MKIAIIAPTAIPSRAANTVQVMKMAQALADIGNEVLLLAPRSIEQSGKTHQPDWTALANHYGLTIADPFPITWLPAHPRLRRYDYSLRAVQAARSWGADLLYTRLPQAAALGSQLGLSTVLEIHDLPSGRMGVWLFQRFLAGRGARRLVVITRALAGDLQKNFAAPSPCDDPSTKSPSKLYTIVAPDGVDLERYQDLPEPSKARQALQPPLPERFTAGYTGHLYAGRGVELILSLAQRLPDVIFLIAGGEPEQVDRVRFQAASAGLENILLTGFVPNALLPRYQAACDILLMPYQTHVAASSGGDIARYLSPMKVFEYLACGRVILSSRLPVLEEVLNDQNSFLLPPDDPQAWETAICQLIDNPDLRSSLAAQARRDAQQYSWQQRASRILSGLGGYAPTPNQIGEGE